VALYTIFLSLLLLGAYLIAIGMVLAMEARQGSKNRPVG